MASGGSIGRRGTDTRRALSPTQVRVRVNSLAVPGLGFSIDAKRSLAQQARVRVIAQQHGLGFLEVLLSFKDNKSSQHHQ